MAEQFVTHKSDLQSNLQIYVTLEITSANIKLTTIDRNVSAIMEVIFERMQSIKEREMAATVRSRGNQPPANDEQLLEEVFRSERELQLKLEREVEQGAKRSNFPESLAAFQEEIQKDVDTILLENRVQFERVFDAMEMRLKEVKDVIIREGDRVIGTILAGVGKGPQERIVDPVRTNLYPNPWTNESRTTGCLCYLG